MPLRSAAGRVAAGPRFLSQSSPEPRRPSFETPSSRNPLVVTIRFRLVIRRTAEETADARDERLPFRVSRRPRSHRTGADLAAPALARVLGRPARPLDGDPRGARRRRPLPLRDLRHLLRLAPRGGEAGAPGQRRQLLEAAPDVRDAPAGLRQRAAHQRRGALAPAAAARPARLPPRAARRDGRADDRGRPRDRHALGAARGRGGPVLDARRALPAHPPDRRRGALRGRARGADRSGRRRVEHPQPAARRAPQPAPAAPPDPPHPLRPRLPRGAANAVRGRRRAGEPRSAARSGRTCSRC